MAIYDVVVIGGGQAGLAMGYYLQQAGLNFVILEGQATPSGSWQNYYDSLTLFSPAKFSNLPAYPFGGDPERYPTRDEVIAYLQEYAAHFNLPILTNKWVQDVARDADKLFTITTHDGARYQARAIVAASGSFAKPRLPHYPKQENFNGTIIHSADYHNPAPFANKRVIVVGAGNSAIQIAAELAEVATVTIASRAPIRFRRQVTLGRDLHWWLKWTGIDYLPVGLRSRLAAKLVLGVGVIDMGRYRAAIRANRPDERRMYTQFTADGVVWADGTTEKVDAVIYATGFRPNVGYLAELGALDEDGHPHQLLGVSTTVKGLYYVGISGQVSIASATLRGVGRDSQLVVGRIKRYIAGQPCCNRERINLWLKRTDARA